jgi:hypothetical protein
VPQIDGRIAQGSARDAIHGKVDGPWAKRVSERTMGCFVAESTRVRK